MNKIILIILNNYYKYKITIILLIIIKLIFKVAKKILKKIIEVNKVHNKIFYKTNKMKNSMIIIIRIHKNQRQISGNRN